MALNFPPSPTIGQIYSEADRSWVWTVDNTWDTIHVSTDPVASLDGVTNKTAARANLDLGSAATMNANDFATATQGSRADQALLEESLEQRLEAMGVLGSPLAVGRPYSTAASHPGNIAYDSTAINFVPFPVGRRGVILDQLAVTITTPLAGGVVHLGVYDSLLGLPNRLIGTTGSVSAAIAAWAPLSVNIPTPFGLIWLAVKPFGGTVGLATASNQNPNNYVPTNTSSPYHNYTMTMLRYAHAPDNLLSTLNPALLSSWNTAPAIHLKASA